MVLTASFIPVLVKSDVLLVLSILALKLVVEKIFFVV
jgi:hypothetical protein